MDKKEIIEVVEIFLNEYGLIEKFEAFIKKAGYTMEEFGFEPDLEWPTP